MQHPVTHFLQTLALALLAALPSWNAFGASATADQAQLVVQGWLRSDPTPLQTTLAQQVKQVDTYSDTKGNTLYYVVSLEPEGYVVVSADDLIEPIIAFIPNGTYSASPKNPLFSLLGNDMPNRLASIPTIHPLALQIEPSAATSKWTSLAALGQLPRGIAPLGIDIVSDLRVAPLLKTTWSQGYEWVFDSGTWFKTGCYNYYTPPYAAGSPDNYVDGCVATAMAQLMKYWEYPTVGVGTASYAISIDGVSTTRALRGGNGSGGPYQWSSMATNPAADLNLTVAQCQAIGALCADAGVAVHMAYSATESGASTGDAAIALTNVFHYANAISGGAQADGWNAMINPNLDCASPVILGISKTGTTGGHAIVCDGYGYNSATLYHHLNMGWGGAADAWYNLPTVDVGVGYNAVNTCVYNVWISGTGEIISGRVTDIYGAPLAGVTVTATRSAGGTYTATTDARGIYGIPKIPSSSTYTLTASKSGYSFSSTSVNTGISAFSGSTSGNKWGADLAAIDPAAPSGFSATAASATRIDLAWAKNAANNNVLIAWSADGTFGTPSGAYSVGSVISGGGTVLLYNSSATSLADTTGLTAGTKRYYKAWSLLPGSVYSTGVTISSTTPYIIPFSEGFEAYETLPNNWTYEYVHGSLAWNFLAGGLNNWGFPQSYIYPKVPHSGSYNAFFFFDSTTVDSTTKMVTPMLAFGNNTQNAQLSFYHCMAPFNGQDELNIYYRTSASGAWTALTNFTSGVTNWTQRVISLPNVNDSYYIAFEGVGKFGCGVAIDDVSVTGEAASTSTIITSTSSVSVPEGNTATFQVKLSAQPAATTSVSVTKVAGGDAEITVSSATPLSFTTSNWNTYQTVTLAAAQDADTANGTATIRCSSSGLANVDVTATEADNDTTLTVNAGTGGSTSPSGATVVTKSAATSISATAIAGYTFANWTNPSGSATFGNANTASTTATISAPATIQANFTANTVTIITSTTAVSVPEGNTATFQVKLSAQPTATKTVSVTRSSGDADITVSSATPLSFTTSDWNTYQTVTLTAAQDNSDVANGSTIIACSSTGLTTVNVTATEVDNDTTLTVTAGTGGTTSPSGATVVTKSAATSISATPSSGYTFANWTITSGSPTIANANAASTTATISAPATVQANFTLIPPSIIVSTNSLVLTEGSGSQYIDVRLSAQPAGNTVVTTTRSSGDTNILVTYNPSITFTRDNWFNDQLVGVGVQENNDITNGTATITSSASGYTSASVAVTEIDNDGILTMSASAGGTVSPSGAIPVVLGGPNSFTVTPATGYYCVDWTILSGTATINNNIMLGKIVGASITTTSTVSSVRANFAANVVAVVLSTSGVGVGEGSTSQSSVFNGFRVKLSAQPTATKTVTVIRSSGDTDLSVNTGASLTFTTSNWDTYQPVKFTAAEDNGDNVNGSAVFAVAATGVTSASVTVTEIDDDYTLTITAVNGTVTKSPNQSLYDSGTGVQLTAVPTAGCSFLNWTGSYSSTANPIFFEMLGNMSLTANFSEPAPLQITSFAYGTQLNFNLQASAGMDYVFQRSTNLVDWVTVSYHTNSTAKSITRDAQLPTCFFRMREAVPSDYTYLVVDLSGGTSATTYPVTYLPSVPSGGWTDEYKTTKLVLRRIPATTPNFSMGSPANELGRITDDETQHQVTLTQDFFIGVFETTQQQWELVMGTKPSYFNNATYYASRPVERVSYNHIRENPANSDDPAVNWPVNSAVNATSFMGKLRTKTGLSSFDLPTESEWEYACRAGTTAALNSGYNLTSTTSDARVGEVARYYYNGGSSAAQGVTTDGGTAKVGNYLANAWGLYDMHGNVAEWCLDLKAPYPGTVTDPKGPSTGYENRIFRGGTLGVDARFCRSAYRVGNVGTTTANDIGFRVSCKPSN